MYKKKTMGYFVVNHTPNDFKDMFLQYTNTQRRLQITVLVIVLNQEDSLKLSREIGVYLLFRRA